MEELVRQLAEENKMLNERLKACEDMLNACVKQISTLNYTLYEEVLNPLEKSLTDAYSNLEYEDWKGKYGEKLSPYSERLSKIENEEKDAVREAFDAYHNDYTDEERENYSADEYIADLITELDSYFNNIRDILGVSENTPVTVTSDESGNVNVEVNNADVTEQITEETEQTEDETPTEETEEKEETEEEVPGTETEESESDKFYKELLRDRAKYMKK